MHEHSLSSVLRRTRIEVAYACEGIAAGRCCSGFKSVVVRYASLPNALMEHLSARVDLCRFKSIHVDDERRERSNVKYDGGFVATPNNSRDDQGALHHVSHAPPRMALLVAAAGAAFVLALTFYLAFAPTFTNDFWFHLKMGEVYWTLGPWPLADPMLHTALPEAPIQHEWLFGVAIYLIQSLTGFFGVRVLHLLAVMAILGLVFQSARRATDNALLACCVTTLFSVLAWTRLFQMRPDLVTILATLATYVLLMERYRVPTARRLAAFGALMLFWANAHSLFALAPLLLFAVVLGLGVRALVAVIIFEGSEKESTLQSARSIAGALTFAIVLAVVVSVANPRGIEQHFTFFTSSSDAAIWAVKDEWSHFDPFDVANHPGSVSPLLWTVMNAVIVAFGFTVLAGIVSVGKRRTNTLDVFNPATFALGAASIVAILVSVRFLWMGVFPLLFVAQAIVRSELRTDTREIVSWVLALTTLVVSIQFYRVGGFATTAARLPESISDYIQTPYLSRKYHVEGVQFLRDTGVEGRLFNSYGMGGFLGYWLSPKLTTFIDSRTEHYLPQVMKEYSRVSAMRELGGRRTFLDILDRREVDFFFGVGMPKGLMKRSRASENTTGHLEGIAGWVVVSRSIYHAIYLRDLPRNEANFERIEKYYAAAGIPFRRDLGFDAAAAIHTDLDWSVDHALLTPDHAKKIAVRNSAARGMKAGGLDALAWTYVLSGSYDAVLEVERELAEVRPVSKTSLRRAIYASLKLEKIAIAKQRAAALVAMSSNDTDSLIFQQLVTAFSETASLPSDPRNRGARSVALARVVQRVPLLSQFEAALLERNLPGEPRVDANDSRSH